MKLFLFWIWVRKLGSSGAARGIRNYSSLKIELGEFIVTVSDRAHLPKKVLVTGWCRSPENSSPRYGELKERNGGRMNPTLEGGTSVSCEELKKMFTWFSCFLQNGYRSSLGFDQECKNHSMCQISLMQEWKWNLWNGEKGRWGKNCRLAHKDITSKD